jgi:hypothetical protein
MRISFTAVVKPILIDGLAAYSAVPGTMALVESIGFTITGCEGLSGAGGDGIFGPDCFAGEVEAGRGRGWRTWALRPPQATEKTTGIRTNGKSL